MEEYDDDFEEDPPPPPPPAEADGNDIDDIDIDVDKMMADAGMDDMMAELDDLAFGGFDWDEEPVSGDGAADNEPQLPADALEVEAPTAESSAPPPPAGPPPDDVQAYDQASAGAASQAQTWAPPEAAEEGDLIIDFDDYGRPTALPFDAFEWCQGESLPCRALSLCFCPRSHARSRAMVAAAYAYDAQSHSELSFTAGEWLALTEKNDDGWWRGYSLAALEAGEPSRYFPSSFMDELSAFKPL